MALPVFARPLPLVPMDATLLLRGAEVLCKAERASISLMQRKLEIGFAHAESLMAHLQASGVVSDPGPDGVRRMLYDKDLNPIKPPRAARVASGGTG